MTVERVRRIGWWLSAGLFGAFIALPLAGTWADLDPTPPVQEKREPAPAPDLRMPDGLTGFARALDAWHADAFGFRDGLLRLNGAVRVLALDSSTTPRAAVGRGGWLYLRGESSTFHRALELFTPEQLERWRALLVARRDWLAARGCRYLVAFIPSKSSIYPEHLPEAERRVGAATRLDQLLDYLRATSTDVPVLDLTPELLASRAGADLYYRTDTHWNAAGAYVGYRALMERLGAWFPEVQPLGPEQVRAAPAPTQGDLAQMLGIETFTREPMHLLAPVHSTARLAPPLEVTASERPRIAPRSFAAGTGRVELPRAVIFRDSFTLTLEPILPEHFERVALVGLNRHHDFVPELIEAEDPDVVVTLSCERFLMLDPPRSPLP